MFLDNVPQVSESWKRVEASQSQNSAAFTGPHGWRCFRCSQQFLLMASQMMLQQDGWLLAPAVAHFAVAAGVYEKVSNPLPSELAQDGLARMRYESKQWRTIACLQCRSFRIQTAVCETALEEVHL